MSGDIFQKVRLIVRGRVQGVGFRRFVYKQAVQIGVGGWVRNNPDGSVETEAWGSSSQILGFIAELRKGPFFSRVDEVEETARETMPSAPNEPFNIKHY